MRFAVIRSSDQGEGSQSQPVEGAVLDDFPQAPDHPKGWFIEIGSLEELMAFMSENGQLIISPRDPNDVRRGIEFPFIEIYDEYRE